MTEAKYAELHAHSAYSFLDGVCQPRELVQRAAELGLSALALTDHHGLYGVVQLAEAAREYDLATAYGAELTLGCGAHLVILARGPAGYARLSRTIARGYLALEGKADPVFELEDLGQAAGGEWLVLTGCRHGLVRRALESGSPNQPEQWDSQAARGELDRLAALFGRDNLAVEITDNGDPLDPARCDALAGLASNAQVPLVATGNVHYASPKHFHLATAMAALNRRLSLDQADGYLPAAPTAHLRTPEDMAYRHRRHPEAVRQAAVFGTECAFDLRLIAPRLPPAQVPEGHSPASWLAELTWRGVERRYGPPGADNTKAYATIKRELAVITQLDLAGYFLIMWEIVEFCRHQKILCQGRGSAANSAVCYALGITAVDAVRHGLLFERFLAPEREGYPDIDLDIESGRREEVIQHVYAKYGRERAALVGAVVSHRSRMSLRDAGRALGYEVGQLDAWTKHLERYGDLRRGKALQPTGGAGTAVFDTPWNEAAAVGPRLNDDLADIPPEVLDLAEQFVHLPRHLGIHPGGMVLCDRPVIEICPVQWGRMPGRTVLQWDKDDSAQAGLVKFDLLGLGMLGAVRLAFEEIERTEAVHLEMHTVPPECPEVYDLLCAADTVGVFQVESRAQMSTLPRLRPRRFYDLVVEVALIRPGPIQGGSVHPYIDRVRGREPVSFDHELLRPALARTLGVPLFQEQLMSIAMHAAGFTPAQADQLRRAMGAKRSSERMEGLKAALMQGMASRGITDPAVRQRIWERFRAFAGFGLPESHSHSFALIVYVSAWLKVFHPAAFYAALLASQPMGFYSPQSLVADARRHLVTVNGPDVAISGAKAMVEVLDPEVVNQAALPEGEARVVSQATLSEGDAAAVERVALATAERTDPAAAEWAALSTAERKTSSAPGSQRAPPVPPPPPPGRTGPHPGLVLGDRRFGVRLGLAQVRGIGQKGGEQIVAARQQAGFTSLDDLARRAQLTTRQMEALATAGALDSLAGDRRQALWAAGIVGGEDTLPYTAVGVQAPPLPTMTRAELAMADHWATGITLGEHPTAHLRGRLEAAGVVRLAEVQDQPVGTWLKVAGVVTHRQRPGTAAGVTFLSLEDETGQLNVVCTADVWNKYRQAARGASALLVTGRMEKRDDAVGVKAGHLHPLQLPVVLGSRDFR